MAARVVGFSCDATSCELARRGVRRGVVEASGSGGVQREWAWSAVGPTSVLGRGHFPSSLSVDVGR